MKWPSLDFTGEAWLVENFFFFHFTTLQGKVIGFSVFFFPFALLLWGEK
jgi:hypothetical protein